jgi:hypothetical protein
LWTGLGPVPVKYRHPFEKFFPGNRKENNFCANKQVTKLGDVQDKNNKKFAVMQH